MTITGTVIHVDLEGGFYGIRGDDGMDYLPNPELSSDFKQDGLRVQAEAEYVDGMSIYMWGTMVKVDKINRI